jgi:branched-chain amino acid aminotransferase
MQLIITEKGLVTKSDFWSGPTNTDQSVYEVIRVIGGVALFLEDHFDRLKQSMEIQGISFGMEYTDFRQKIAEIITLNLKTEGNIKFSYLRIGNESEWFFTFIPHSYPNPEDYLNGVPTDLLFAERENPNAKVVQNAVRELANQNLTTEKIYEVLLVDRNGLITEGSRSNVFFVKDNVFYTAPASQVLVGVTRQKVIECLNELSFQFVETDIHADEISRYDAAFLTGTSPKVLPIRSIGDQMFRTGHAAVKQLMKCYNDLIDRYIQSHGDQS